jgi:hypothetical protein
MYRNIIMSKQARWQTIKRCILNFLRFSGFKPRPEIYYFEHTVNLCYMFDQSHHSDAPALLYLTEFIVLTI